MGLRFWGKETVAQDPRATSPRPYKQKGNGKIQNLFRTGQELGPKPLSQERDRTISVFISEIIISEDEKK